MLRGRPPGFPSGIIESTNGHCASVKSVAYVLIPVSKNLERSLRIRLVTARTFQTASKTLRGSISAEFFYECRSRCVADDSQTRRIQRPERSSHNFAPSWDVLQLGSRAEGRGR